MKDWPKSIQPGDMMHIDPFWNETTPPRTQIKDQPALAVEHGVWGCQTGTLVTVLDKSGNRKELDAGWFIPPSK